MTIHADLQYVIAQLNEIAERLKHPESVLDTPGTVKDIDGNVYKTVKIGGQVWMAENLRTLKCNNGKRIPLITNAKSWKRHKTPAICWYDNNPENKMKYGGLYNWYAVNTSRLAPKGWHVPTDEEWTTLAKYLGGSNVAGGKLKETSITHWNSPNTGATNESGFSALPGGFRYYDGSFNDLGYNGYWWSATAYDATYAWYRSLNYDYENVHRNDYYKVYGFSVRCLRD